MANSGRSQHSFILAKGLIIYYSDSQSWANGYERTKSRRRRRKKIATDAKKRVSCIIGTLAYRWNMLRPRSNINIAIRMVQRYHVKYTSILRTHTFPAIYLFYPSVCPSDSVFQRVIIGFNFQDRGLLF